MAAAVVAAGLGLTAPAHASSPSVQLQICNNSPQTGTAEITGLNQHDARVSTPLTTISGNGCRLFANWWWKTGQTVHVAMRRNSLTIWDFTLSSSERDGSTVTFSLT
ncbi:hypothetical protein UK23_23880 [Lentzea aerocolonigenes]|uniref:Uncharacterized protein n=1 Tax=Lentzea aerocolonigenes TaxID=68170 RepID=A0A0F0GSJ3_LENAE|nr:hypothetical protein UK23_23880 [Lentzea aerocolonigenes]